MHVQPLALIVMAPPFGVQPHTPVAGLQPVVAQHAAGFAGVAGGAVFTGMVDCTTQVPLLLHVAFWAHLSVASASLVQSKPVAGTNLQPVTFPATTSGTQP
jgi:hypothetical protein